MPKLRGADAHTKRLKKLQGERVIRVANAVVYEGADIIRAEAHRSISEGSVSGKGHVPSKPEEPPNRDTGELQAGMEVSNPRPLVGRLTSSSDHAAPMEFGTSTVTERPHIRPARDKMRPTVQRNFVKKMQELVKRSGQ